MSRAGKGRATVLGVGRSAAVSPCEPLSAFRPADDRAGLHVAYLPADTGDWQATILALWREATYREQRYAAVELAVHRPFLCWLNMESVPFLDELIVDGAWWDYIDRIAPAGLGHVLAAETRQPR